MIPENINETFEEKVRDLKILMAENKRKLDELCERCIIIEELTNKCKVSMARFDKKKSGEKKIFKGRFKIDKNILTKD
jgi:hypothetical protein